MSRRMVRRNASNEARYPSVLLGDNREPLAVDIDFRCHVNIHNSLGRGVDDHYRSVTSHPIRIRILVDIERCGHNLKVLDQAGRQAKLFKLRFHLLRRSPAAALVRHDNLWTPVR
jgi:hypothetical protein